MLRSNYSGGIRRVAGMNAALATDVGIVRTQNQDRVVMARGKDFNGDTYLLAILCDGMGGMQDGEYCAATTIASFISSFIKTSRKVGMANDWLIESAMAANHALHKKYSGTGGATLSSVLLKQDGRAYWINVGDSRIYQTTPTEVTQITRDDTIAGQLGKNEAPSSRTSELLQYIGIGEVLEPHVSRLSLEGSSYIVLTSDGIHYLQPETFNSLITKSKDPGTCARRLIEVAKWCSGHDNCSTAIIEASTAESIGNIRTLPSQFDIWDPFGELQLFDEPIEPNETSIKSEKNRQRRVITPKASEHRKKIRATGKTKKTEKTEKTKKESSEIIPEFKSEKVPQLKISFPIKDD